MNYAERLQKLAAERGLSVMQLAELFGVDYQTMWAWYEGKASPRHEFRLTLARFESDAKAAISPRVSEKTAQAFYGASL